MKAFVYHDSGRSAWEGKPKPRIEAPTDAIVQISKTTICGTDLHILKGDVPAVTDGRILGHEGTGTVVEIGSGVSRFKVGERVIISCITACGACEYCKQAMYSHCTTGGWILGNTIDGTQADFVRTPHADMSLYAIPEGVDEDAMVLLSDILATGHECGVLNGKIQPGDTVAIVGAGPIGLSVLLTAQLYSPSEIIMIDLDDNRLEAARKMGATKTVNSKDGHAVKAVLEMTSGRGVDVAIEAVGIPATFNICQDIVTAGGHLANIGVHGESVELHLENLWFKNLTLTTRLVDTSTIPMLLKMVQSGKIKPGALISHHFKLADIQKAYDTFRDAAKTSALKVILEA